METLLNVEGINVYYGAIHAIKDISFHVNEGEIVTLIGANGAGKTTTLQTISGLLRSKTGSITFEGQNISNVRADKLVARGLAQVPEGRRVFLQMSVEENLEMGAYTQSPSGVPADLEMVFELFPRLKERRRQVAGTLSGGEQQMLAMGRALHGSGPHPGGADLRDHPEPEQERLHHPPGGTERPDGLVRGPPGLCTGDRPRGHHRHRRGAHREPRDQKSLPGRVTYFL